MLWEAARIDCPAQMRGYLGELGSLGSVRHAPCIKVKVGKAAALTVCGAQALDSGRHSIFGRFKKFRRYFDPRRSGTSQHCC